MKKTIITIVLSGLICGSIVSCLEEPQCRENENRLLLNFISVTDGKALPVKLDSIWVKEQNRGYYHGQTKSEVEIPLAINWDRVYFEIYKDSAMHSVEMTYLATPILYASDCNVEIVLSNHHIVDTANLDSIATRFNETPARLNIYF